MKDLTEHFVAGEQVYDGGLLKVPFDEALAMVRDGRITDAKSVAGLLWFKAFRD